MTGPGSTVTARERQVLALVADGLGNEEIGRRLFVTKNTVRAHVSSALRKLGAHNRAHAVALAIRGDLFVEVGT